MTSIRSPVRITSFTGPVATRTGGTGWLCACAHLSAILSTVVSRASAYTSGDAPRMPAHQRHAVALDALEHDGGPAVGRDPLEDAPDDRGHLPVRIDFLLHVVELAADLESGQIVAEVFVGQGASPPADELRDYSTETPTLRRDAGPEYPAAMKPMITPETPLPSASREELWSSDAIAAHAPARSTCRRSRWCPGRASAGCTTASSTTSATSARRCSCACTRRAPSRSRTATPRRAGA